MHKRICFIHTDTNGLHKYQGEVSKKKLYAFARLVVLNYDIGYIKDNKYYEEINENIIIKPNCMIINEDTIKFHGITNEIANDKGTDINDVLDNFKNDLKNVNVIVGHNIDFHLKTLLSEYVRYNINIDLSKYLIIDTISFYHNFGFLKLKDLAHKLLIKDINDKNNLELIRETFFKLYSKFEKSLINK
jgi:DNA polymerase III epsilon subunit-like protein